MVVLVLNLLLLTTDLPLKLLLYLCLTRNICCGVVYTFNWHCLKSTKDPWIGDSKSVVLELFNPTKVHHYNVVRPKLSFQKKNLISSLFFKKSSPNPINNKTFPNIPINNVPPLQSLPSLVGLCVVIALPWLK